MEVVNSVALVLFTVGLVFGVMTTGIRMLTLRRRGLRQPRLIWRDVTVFGLLAIDFLIVAVHRVAGVPVIDHDWFVVLTSMLALAAVAVYDYYEWRVIGRVYERRDD